MTVASVSASSAKPGTEDTGRSGTVVLVIVGEPYAHEQLP